jgi:DNA-binding CsgD family transcriptional regulator/tetratricopeptide (TPR) repeat protein
MRAALEWFLEHDDAERGLHLASRLTWFWSSRSYFREARQWLEAFLTRPTSVPTRGRGLLEAANILHWLGDHDAATRYADESLAIFQQHGAAFLAMCALRRLGGIAIDQEDFEQAARYLKQSRALVHSAESPWDASRDVAYDTFLARRLAAAANRGDEAIDRFTEASEAFRAIGDRGYVAAALGLLGAEWIKKGNVSGARRAYTTSLELASELGDHACTAWALIGAAHVAHGAGDGATTVRLLGAATAMREAIGEARLPERALPLAPQTALGDDRFAQEWAQGASMDAVEAIALARSVLEQDGAGPRSSGAGYQPHSGLTARERAVLRLLAEGLGDKAIAVTLGMSRRTASNHVAAILTKLGATSRTAAVSQALQQGLLSAAPGPGPRTE